MNSPVASRDVLAKSTIVFVALWIAAVFFYKDHYFTVSRFDEWAPWAASGVVASGGNVLKGAALCSIGLLGAYLLATRKEPGRTPHWALLATMFAYVGWCFASVLWTADRGATVRQLIVLLAVFVGAWGIASRTQPRDLLKMLLIICGSFLAIGLFAELSLGTFRPWAGGYRFAGTVHPNAQGGLCATLAISSLAWWLARGDAGRNRDAPGRVAPPAKSWAEWLPAILFAAAMVGLVLSKSRTCLAGCVIACGVLLLFRVSARTKALVGFAGVWALVGAGFLLALSGVDLAAEAESAMYMGRQEESEALSGRLPIWTELSNYVAERPWQGYGYAAFWTEDRIDTISQDVMWVFREAHSTFFELLLSVGAVGLFFFIASALGAAGVACRRALRGDGYAAYLLALMVFFSITAFTESSVVWPCLETTVLGIALFQLALRRGEAAETSPRRVEASAPRRYVAEVQP